MATRCGPSFEKRAKKRAPQDDGGTCGYLPFPHSFATAPSSAATVFLIAEGVREKRGAGAGCTTPSWLTKILRSAMCGCCGASDSDSTGAKQTSVPSMIAHHSARVLV